MSALIGIYFGTVTAGGTDGTRASEGTEGTPITIGRLDLSENEVSDWMKLAIRCDSGYVSAAGTPVEPDGTTELMWQFAPDNGSGSPGTPLAYGAAIEFASAIPDTNVLFHARAKAIDSELPLNDTSVNFVITPDISPE